VVAPIYLSSPIWVLGRPGVTRRLTRTGARGEIDGASVEDGVVNGITSWYAGCPEADYPAVTAFRVAVSGYEHRLFMTSHPKRATPKNFLAVGAHGF